MLTHGRFPVITKLILKPSKTKLEILQLFFQIKNLHTLNVIRPTLFYANVLVIPQGSFFHHM